MLSHFSISPHPRDLYHRIWRRFAVTRYHCDGTRYIGNSINIDSQIRLHVQLAHILDGKINRDIGIYVVIRNSYRRTLDINTYRFNAK